MKIIEQLFTVLNKVEIVGKTAFTQRVLGQQAIIGVVVRHQNDNGFGRWIHAAIAFFGCRTGKVIMKRAPSPGLLFAVIVPPCRSVMRRHTASPTPVPSYSLRP